MEIFPCVCVCVYVSVYVSACVSKEGEQWARRGKKLLNKWFLPFPSSSFSKWMMKMNGREREQDRQTGREGNWVNWCSNRLHVSYKIHTNFFFSFHRYQFEYRAQEWPLLLFFFCVVFIQVAYFVRRTMFAGLSDALFCDSAEWSTPPTRQLFAPVLNPMASKLIGIGWIGLRRKMRHLPMHNLLPVGEQIQSKLHTKKDRQLRAISWRVIQIQQFNSDWNIF